MMNGAIACTSLMPDLIDEIPEIVDTSLFYTWNNIDDTAETVRQLLNQEDDRLHLAQKGQRIAETYFTPKRYASEIINIYSNVFGEGNASAK